MKSCILSAALLGMVSATTPPKIELDLSDVNSLYQLPTPIYRKHNLGYTQPAGSGLTHEVNSRQDYSQACPAAASTNELNCPFPSAKAYDTNDGQSIAVVTHVYLVDDDGVTKNDAVTSVDFAKRSTYLLKYDAMDKAGNHAEQVVFALILNDLTKPVIGVCAGPGGGTTVEAVEAATHSWELCTTTTATDNIDNVLTSELKVSVERVRPSQAVLLTDGTQLEARAVCTTVRPENSQGNLEYLVTYTVHDHAGVYGVNSVDNHETAQKAITMDDTNPPWIVMNNYNPQYHECAKPYSDPHATAFDDLDTIALGLVLDVTATPSNIATTLSARDKVGSYEIEYNAKDQDNNQAATQTRTINVRDTLRPTITLRGLANVIVHTGSSFTDDGTDCVDECTDSLTTTTAWTGHTPGSSGPAIDLETPGDYFRTYTCTDASSNSHFITRKFTVVDSHQPVITIQGAAIETYEASRDVQYTDKGASCSDSVDGDIDENVEVSGEVVNMHNVGVYTIRYDCEDESGNQAPHETRTVHVVDTTCPHITMNGAFVNYVEAGYKYVDADASASDSRDGVLTKTTTECTNTPINGVGCHWADGNTITDKKAFYGARSCKDIKASYAAAVTGYYYISTGDSTSTLERKSTWCDMCASADGKTYLDIPTTGTPNQAVTFVNGEPTSHGSCAALGLQVAGYSYYSDAAKLHFAGSTIPDPTNPSASTTEYLCTTDTFLGNGELQKWTVHMTTDLQISEAEQGKYIILYHAKDAAGNRECETIYRTVVVKDTVPPVITLHYGSAGAPIHLMAENTKTTGVNMWAVAAAGSAVAGLALVAVGSKKPAVTAVPV